MLTKFENNTLSVCYYFLQAHAPLEYLYDIDVNDIKLEDQPQV